MGSQVEERGDRIRQATDGDSAKSKKGSFTYDDSGTGTRASCIARQGQG